MATKDVTLSGDLFTDPDGILDQLGIDIETALAEEVTNLIHTTLKSKIKRSTGHLEGNIVTNRVQGDLSVNDNGVVYGAWIEGESERNNTTRFKGYAAFRSAAQDMESRSGEIADQIAQRRLAELS